VTHKERKTYRGTLSLAEHEVPVTFTNGPLLSVSIDHDAPFFREVEERWNECHVEKADPHRPLQRLAQVGNSFSTSDKEQFVKRFLLLAAVATRQLEEGQEHACASLEHHAHQVNT